jgi:hypothetical protein
MKDNEQRVVAHLDRAIGELLATRVMLGGVADAAVPDDALDVALQSSPEVQDARRAFLAALATIDVSGDAVARQTYLRIEETANSVAAKCAVAGWRLGLLAATGREDIQED